MTMFDSYMVVDWSANGSPKTGRDSIWIAHLCNHQPIHLVNPPTRTAAMAHIAATLHAEGRQGRRVLVGFDFAFGYPAGLAHALGSDADWRTIWAMLHDGLTDGPDNANNRFDLAARLNGLFPGDGPFWGNGLARDIPGLPRRKPGGWDDTLPANRRLADSLASGAQEVWKLSGAGSVGGQTLTGIAALEGLRRQIPLTVWPFQPLTADPIPVIAEIFPSLIPLDPGLHPIRDAAQVIGLARTLRDQDSDGRLAAFLRSAETLPDHIRHHEGMILGLSTL
jgi:precorrin-8X/cobalt-precorrin-8 methylmutase